eukprot:m.253783 g.253783  ORF g.253783 m.253783 type:complete len:158 (+) comp17396_c0_seq1:58-531(+)
MASRQVGKKVIDWASIVARLPSYNAPEIALVQDKYNSVKSGLSRLPEAPPAINWDKYAQMISYKGFVADVRKQYESKTFKYPADTASATISADEQVAVTRAKELVQAAEKNIAELEQQLAALKSEKPLDQVTVDEVLANKPEWKRRFREEIEAGKWD